jgi:hypothetical protein
MRHVDASNTNDWLCALTGDELARVSGGRPQAPKPATKGKLFEVEDYSFDIEQTLSIGSQSSGAGAGK